MSCDKKSGCCNECSCEDNLLDMSAGDGAVLVREDGSLLLVLPEGTLAKLQEEDFNPDSLSPVAVMVVRLYQIAELLKDKLGLDKEAEEGNDILDHLEVNSKPVPGEN